MIIKDKSNNEQLMFESLELEDIFKFDGRIFMKVSNLEDEQNSYDFSKHRLTDISADTLVHSAVSTLTIKYDSWYLLKNWNENINQKYYIL